MSETPPQFFRPTAAVAPPPRQQPGFPPGFQGGTVQGMPPGFQGGPVQGMPPGFQGGAAPGFPPGFQQAPTDDFNEQTFYPGAFQPQGNPLMKYFRVPGMHVSLPSKGAYLPEGAIEFTATGEIPVYPMRAADEILLKNPDSLMSGFAVEQMLTSCVPAIRAPQLISMPDLDVLFLAIRAASFGDKMEFEVKCPKCGEENVFDADLPTLLQRVTELPTECPVRLTDEVVAYMRPYNLRNATTVAVATFEETRRLQAVMEEDEKVRSQAMTGSIKRIAELSNRMMADCVMYVVTPDGAESDPSRVSEFLANIPRGWTNKIEIALRDLNSYGLDKTIHPTCTKCEHQWETSLEFDPASFFGQGS
jgi:hypothetical protein